MTPLVSLCVQPESVPGPPDVGVAVAIASETVDTSVVTVLPYWSSTVTCGCVGKAMPPVELAGWAVNTSLLAVAGPMTVGGVLVAVVSVREVSVAVIV